MSRSVRSCPECDGTGEVEEGCCCYQCEYDDTPHRRLVPCLQCDGTGRAAQATSRGQGDRPTSDLGQSVSRPMTRDEATCIVRSIFRRCGYAIAEHGTRGRDLDLVAVPWTDRAGMPSIIVAEVIEALEGEMVGEPERKPHGRVAYAIHPGNHARHDLWYVDLSVLVPDKYQDEIDPREFRDAA